MKSWPQFAVPVICCRIDDPERKDVPGSTIVPCWNCGEEVKISPATLERAKKLEVTVADYFPGFSAVEALTKSKIICVQCAAAYCEANNQKLHLLPDTEDQRKERDGQNTI